MFVAFRYQPGFGPLAVAYAAANIASALPLTPGGLGVAEVTLVAVTAGFGTPRATAVLAILAYRLVNYWLPLPFGTVAYARIKLGKDRHVPPSSPAAPAQAPRQRPWPPRIFRRGQSTAHQPPGHSTRQSGDEHR